MDSRPLPVAPPTRLLGRIDARAGVGRHRPEEGLCAAALLAAALVVPAGCGADERPANWQYISTVIMQPNCATVSCHSRAAAVAGLDFSDPERGYTSLTKLKVWVVNPSGTPADGCRNIKGTVVCQRGFRPMVTPYNPEQSRIVNMMRGRNAARMPPDRPLTEASIELVERWIRAGALYGPPVSDGGAAERPAITVVVTISDAGFPDDAFPADAGAGVNDAPVTSADAGALD